MLELKPIFNSLLRSKAGALLLLIQIAITTAIVSNAAFIIQDHVSYLQKDTGYPQDEIFRFTVMTFGEDRNLTQQFEVDETMLRNIPGVRAAGLVAEVPLSGSGSSSSFRLKPAPEQSRTVSAGYTFADETVLDVFGVDLAEGRGFLPEEVVVTDDTSARPSTAIVAKAFADEMFPEGGALGSTIYLGANPLEIVGIVETMMSSWPRSSVGDKLIIIPMVVANPYQHIMVRTDASDRSTFMRDIEDTMLKAYDQRVIINVEGLDEAKRTNDSSDILMMRMLVVIICVLVLITALGIFGLTQFNISKRTKQIGTRRALGARKSAIVRYFLIENSLICFVGLILGSISAIVLGDQLMQLYSIPALDSAYVAATAAAVFVLSILAVILPAKRAANISPSIATRSV